VSPDETTLAVACAHRNCIKVICVDGSKAPRTIGGPVGGSGDGQLNVPIVSATHQTGSSWWTGG
jgi:hypothetical protein